MEKGGNEDVRNELERREAEVRMRNIRRQGKNFVIEGLSEKDLTELRKSDKMKEAEFVVNGEPDMRDPCVIVRGVDTEIEENDIKKSIWRRNKDLLEEWKIEDCEKEFRVRGRVGPRTGRSVAWVIQVTLKLYKRVLWFGRLYRVG